MSKNCAVDPRAAVGNQANQDLGQSGMKSHGMSRLHEVNDTNFAAEVLQSKQPVLVDFWAPWCEPCRLIAPVLEELAAEYDGSIKVVKVNVDNNPGVAAEYKIDGIPVMILFDGGEVVDRLIGVQQKEHLQAAIDRVVD